MYIYIIYITYYIYITYIICRERERWVPGRLSALSSVSGAGRRDSSNHSAPAAKTKTCSDV